MREQAPDLAIKRADELPALGHRDAEQLLGCQAERVTSPSSSNTRRSTPCADGCWGPKLRVKLRRVFSAITASRQLPVQRRLPTGGSNLCGTGTAVAGARAPQKASLSLAKDARADSLEVDVLGSTPALPPAAVGGKACLMARAGDHAIAPARLAISASIQA